MRNKQDILTEKMFSLDDATRFERVLLLEAPWAHSYADMRPGKTDKERRENWRKKALEHFSGRPAHVLWWAFRIEVFKAGRLLDVDNIAKTVIDSFSGSQIRRDKSAYKNLELYPDDTFDHVRVLQVVGNRSEVNDLTRVEIFACVRD